MTDTIDRRAQEIAVYVIETGATVRSAAERFVSGIGADNRVFYNDQYIDPRVHRYIYELSRKQFDRLAAEGSDARVICLALAVPKEIVHKEVEGKCTANDYRENTPKPLVANELVELKNDHFTL